MVERARILIIDNLAVESSRRHLYRLLGQRPEFEIHVMVPRHWKETAVEVDCEDETTNHIRLHTSRILFGHRHHRVVYADLFKVLRIVEPEFVLAVHAPENYATLQLLVARRLRFPSMRIGLFASRNVDLPSVGFPFKLAFINGICDWVTATSKVDVVYHRPAGSGHLYQRYSRRAVYVPHSVDCSVFLPHPPTTGSGEIMLGYVGRLAEVKGVNILIEGLSRLPQSVRLTIVGEGSDRGRLQALARDLGVADRIEFHTPIGYAAMPQLLHRIDVLVLPSLETLFWKELFGRILIEAMACGVPVVASDSGGIPDVVGEAGVLFKTGSSSDLVSKISSLIQVPSRLEELGRRGRERAVRLFDTQIVAETLAKDLATTLS